MSLRYYIHAWTCCIVAIYCPSRKWSDLWYGPWWHTWHIGDIVSESGPISMPRSESGPTSFEVSTSTDDHFNLTTVVECVNPPTRMTPCELNSRCSYFIYPVENSTSLENDTMTFMCTKYPHLREQIQFYKSGKKWDDMINEIFNKLNTSTTSQRH